MKNKRKRWKNGVILIPVLCVLLLTGCGLFQEEKIKLRDLDFTVLSDEKIPEELKTVIVEKGTEPFHMTYIFVVLKINKVTLVVLPFNFFSPFLAIPTAYGSSQARDQI